MLFVSQRLRFEDASGTERFDEALRCGDAFAVEGEGPFVLRRERIAPRRGVSRLLIPHVVARLRLTHGGAQARIKSDGLAVFFLMMLVGGVAVALTLPRSQSPREYPAAFICGLAGAYLVALLVESVLGARALAREVSVSRTRSTL